MKAKVKVNWTPDELSFLRENYHKMTWAQLVDAIREYKSNIEIGSIRHQCLRMGLKKQTQIRWCKEDISFLQENYRRKGNIEIAEQLTKMKRTYRIINGERHYRVFTKKHVEKKLKLLNLFRTRDERYFIYKRNLRIGKGYSWTKEKNAYTLGIRPVAKNGEIRKWVCNGNLRVYIKTQTGFESLSRKTWTDNYGKIPPGHAVFFKDGNPENYSIENLECISRSELVKRNITKYPPELKRSIRLYNKLNKTIRTYE